MLLKDKKRAYEKARRRTKTELKAALDTGGSVWIFGTGPFGEFTAPPPKTLSQGEHEFAHYDIIKVGFCRIIITPTVLAAARWPELGGGVKQGKLAVDSYGFLLRGYRIFRRTGV